MSLFKNLKKKNIRIFVGKATRFCHRMTHSKPAVGSTYMTNVKNQGSNPLVSNMTSNFISLVTSFKDDMSHFSLKSFKYGNARIKMLGMVIMEYHAFLMMVILPGSCNKL
jgi:hypothetical protein